MLEDNGKDFNGNNLEILVKREADKGVSEQEVAQALINASDKQDNVGSILQSVKVGLSDKSTLAEKRKVNGTSLEQQNRQTANSHSFILVMHKIRSRQCGRVFRAVDFETCPMRRSFCTRAI